MTATLSTPWPWSTPKEDRAWRKIVRDEYRQVCARNPKLMRRLAKLTDAQLSLLYRMVLETEPASPKRDAELRSLREIEAFRSMPKPVKRRGNVPRLRDPQPGHSATLQERPPELAALGSLDLTAPTATASQPPAPAAPPAPKPSEPSNVIFAGKFFHGGRTNPRWIGHE